MSDMITSKTINNLIMSGLIELKSVGCLLDSDIGVVYPQNEDGTPDYNCPISLYEDEPAADWWEALSDEDYDLCKKY